MSHAARSEIQRLTRLHQAADLELLLLVGRSYLTVAQQAQLRDLKKRKLQLKDRIAWCEAILCEHQTVTAK